MTVPEIADLNRVRLERNLSYRRLSDLVGIPQRTLFRILTTSNPVCYDRTLFKIRTFLNRAGDDNEHTL